MASAVATPLEQQFAAIPGARPDDLDERPRLDRRSRCNSISTATSTAPRRTCRRRSTPPAACCRRTCRTRRPTGRPTRPTAPVLIYAVHSDALPIYAGRRLRLHDPGAEAVDGDRRLAGRYRRPAEARGARPGQSRRAGAAAASASRTCAPRSPTATVNRPKGNLEGAHQTVTLDTNDQLFDAAAFDNVIVAYRNGAPVRVKDIGDVDRFGRAQPRRRLVRRQAGRAAADPARRPAPTPSPLVDHDQGDDAAAAGLDPAVGQGRSGVGPLADHPRLGRRRAVHDDADRSASSSWSSSSSCARCGRRSSRASPCRCRCSAPSRSCMLLGYSLDNISLMALTIAVGFVVDDAIVMIENIVRYIEAGRAAASRPRSRAPGRSASPSSRSPSR